MKAKQDSSEDTKNLLGRGLVAAAKKGDSELFKAYVRVYKDLGIPIYDDALEAASIRTESNASKECRQEAFRIFFEPYCEKLVAELVDFQNELRALAH